MAPRARPPVPARGSRFGEAVRWADRRAWRVRGEGEEDTGEEALRTPLIRRFRGWNQRLISVIFQGLSSDPSDGDPPLSIDADPRHGI